jgi:hypothetical protein
MWTLTRGYGIAPAKKMTAQVVQSIFGNLLCLSVENSQQNPSNLSTNPPTLTSHYLFNCLRNWVTTIGTWVGNVSGYCLGMYV